MERQYWWGLYKSYTTGVNRVEYSIIDPDGGVSRTVVEIPVNSSKVELTLKDSLPKTINVTDMYTVTQMFENTSIEALVYVNGSLDPDYNAGTVKLNDKIMTLDAQNNSAVGVATTSTPRITYTPHRAGVHQMTVRNGTLKI